MKVVRCKDMGLLDFLFGNKQVIDDESLKRVKALEAELESLRNDLKQTKRTLGDQLEETTHKAQKTEQRVLSMEGSHYRLVRTMKEEIRRLAPSSKITIQESTMEDEAMKE